MIVVDSSVLVPYLSDIETPEVARLRETANLTQVLIGDLVLLEVLQGARTTKDAERIERVLSLFDTRIMLGVEVARAAARNFRTLRALGVNIRKTTDLIIGTFCLENDHQLLHRDRDFVHMEQHLGLRRY